MNINIAMPILDKVHAKTMVSLINMLSSTAGHKLFFNPSIGTTVIHDSRNNLVEQAYKTDFDAILFIDSDMVFPQDTLTRLLAHDKDIVGVRYVSRVNGKANVFRRTKSGNDYERWECGKGLGLLEACAVGTGIMLAKRKVFDAIGKPYFFYTNLGEDVNFCHHAQVAGFKVYVDTDIDVGHIGEVVMK